MAIFKDSILFLLTYKAIEVGEREGKGHCFPGNSNGKPRCVRYLDEGITALLLRSIVHLLIHFWALLNLASWMSLKEAQCFFLLLLLFITICEIILQFYINLPHENSLYTWIDQLFQCAVLFLYSLLILSNEKTKLFFLNLQICQTQQSVIWGVIARAITHLIGFQQSLPDWHLRYWKINAV